MTVVFGRYAPTCNTEPNSDFEALKQEPLTLALPKRRTARRERELTVVFGRYTPTCNTEPNLDFEALKQEPLTLALSLYVPDTWWTGVRRHGGHFLIGTLLITKEMTCVLGRGVHCAAS
ncbi:hypothetical protein, partial [Pseudomonas monsensis]|uniref:hypothetical protein n=1 Tax=Pseudomonas monsensis TaxID=2745509 RepID=UPI00300E76F0